MFMNKRSSRRFLLGLISSVMFFSLLPPQGFVSKGGPDQFLAPGTAFVPAPPTPSPSVAREGGRVLTNRLGSEDFSFATRRETHFLESNATYPYEETSQDLAAKFGKNWFDQLKRDLNSLFVVDLKSKQILHYFVPTEDPNPIVEFILGDMEREAGVPTEDTYSIDRAASNLFVERYKLTPEILFRYELVKVGLQSGVREKEALLQVATKIGERSLNGNKEEIIEESVNRLAGFLNQLHFTPHPQAGLLETGYQVLELNLTPFPFSQRMESFKNSVVRTLALSDEFQALVGKNGKVLLFYKGKPFAKLFEHNGSIVSSPVLKKAPATKDEKLEYFNLLYNALGLVSKRTETNLPFYDEVMNRQTTLEDLFNEIHKLRGTIPPLQHEFPFPDMLLKKPKGVAIHLDPANEGYAKATTDATFVALMAQLKNTLNIKPVIIFGNWPRGLRRNLNSSLYGDLYPGMKVKEFSFLDPTDRKKKRKITYGWVTFNGRRVWVVKQIKDLEWIQADRRGKGLSPLPLKEVDLIYSPQEEIQQMDVWTRLVKTTPPIYTHTPPVERTSSAIPGIAMDVNDAALELELTSIPQATRRASSSFTRVIALILKQLFQNGLNPSRVGVRLSSQIIAGEKFPTLDKGGHVSLAQNEVDFRPEDLQALKREMMGLFAHANGGIPLDFSLEAGFNGFAEGSSATLYFDVDGLKFDRQSSGRLDEEGKTITWEAIEQSSRERIQAKIREVLGKGLAGLIEFDPHPMATTDVTGERKIFVGPNDVEILNVDREVDDLNALIEKLWPILNQDKTLPVVEETRQNIEAFIRRVGNRVAALNGNGTPEVISAIIDEEVEEKKAGERAIYREVASKLIQALPKESIARSYQVKVKVHFDRFRQDAAHLLRLSEEFGTDDDEKLSVTEMKEMLEDPNSSELENRKKMAFSRGTVSPLPVETEHPQVELTKDPLSIYIQAPVGRMGKVPVKQLLLQAIALQNANPQFNRGYTNIRVAGIMAPPDDEDLLVALKKDSTYGQTGAKIEFEEIKDDSEAAKHGIWGSIRINGSEKIYLINNVEKVGGEKKYLKPKALKRPIQHVNGMAGLTPWQKENITVYANAGVGYKREGEGSVQNFLKEDVKTAGVEWVMISAPWDDEQNQLGPTLIFNLSNPDLFDSSHLFSPGSCTTNCGIWHVVMNRFLFGTPDQVKEAMAFIEPKTLVPLLKVRQGFLNRLFSIFRERNLLPDKEVLQKYLLTVIAEAATTEEESAVLEAMELLFPARIKEALLDIRRRARELLEEDQQRDISHLVKAIAGIIDPNDLSDSLRAKVGVYREEFERFLTRKVEALHKQYPLDITQLKGMLISIHAWTNKQPLFDAFALTEEKVGSGGKDASAGQIVNASTGFQTAANLVIALDPNERLEALAARIPVATGSEIISYVPVIFDHLNLKDLPEEGSADREKELDAIGDDIAEAINSAYRDAALHAFGGSLHYADKHEMLTSRAIKGKYATSIFDGGQTKAAVTPFKNRGLHLLIQHMLWYDNEWGFSAQVLGLLDSLARYLDAKRDDAGSVLPWLDGEEAAAILKILKESDDRDSSRPPSRRFRRPVPSPVHSPDSRRHALLEIAL